MLSLLNVALNGRKISCSFGELKELIRSGNAVEGFYENEMLNFFTRNLLKDGLYRGFSPKGCRLTLRCFAYMKMLMGYRPELQRQYNNTVARLKGYPTLEPYEAKVSRTVLKGLETSIGPAI